MHGETVKFNCSLRFEMSACSVIPITKFSWKIKAKV